MIQVARRIFDPPRETTTAEGAAMVHSVKMPADSDRQGRRALRMALRHAFGQRVSEEDFAAEGFRECRTPYGQTRCRCGYYRVEWPRAEGAPA